ncbi:MAG: hypothetical protein KIT84_24405 [Labilithrix sp.]|nr:hypothetical protein [Labilithrix sp.]MCW5814191.1 hypothetical protein [Labilithrix sp.]
MPTRAWLAAAVLLIGCRPFDADDPREPEPDTAEPPMTETMPVSASGSPGSSGADGADAPEDTVPASRPAARWHGALNETRSEHFKESLLLCWREVSFKDIVFDLELAADGKPTSAVLTATAVDDGSCSVTLFSSSQREQRLTYQLGPTRRILPDGTHELELRPVDDANPLKASLVVSGHFTGEESDGKLLWTRSDSTPWSLEANVRCKPKPVPQ